MKVAVTQLHHRELELPKYMTPDAAGMDLLAAVDEPVLLKPMERCLIPTGIAIALPENTEAQIRPRSGLALKHGITILNAPGTIDADYRGEIKVLLINLGNEEYAIEPGERMAQIVFAAVKKAEWEIVDRLDDSERSSGGFGHTGK